jgi:hypothetical protein
VPIPHRARYANKYDAKVERQFRENAYSESVIAIGPYVASTYRHFDLETLAKGVASIPVPADKSSHQTDADSAIADHREPLG